MSSREGERTEGRNGGRFILPLVIGLVTTAGGGCEAIPVASDEGSPVFFTQSEVPDAHMDALFEGPVVRDEAGCLRLSSADGATVVWPTGFTLDDGGLVRDAEGQVIGRIGSSFQIPGGEVPILHDGLAVSDEVRSRAETHCPGRYWIAGGF